MSSSLCDLLEVGVDSVAPGDVLVVAGAVVEAAVQDADPTVAECSEGLVVRVASGTAVVVERVGLRGSTVIEENAHWSSASARRSLRTNRASTTDLVPDARVMGDVPA